VGRIDGVLLGRTDGGNVGAELDLLDGGKEGGTLGIPLCIKVGEADKLLVGTLLRNFDGK